MKTRIPGIVSSNDRLWGAPRPVASLWHGNATPTDRTLLDNLWILDCACPCRVRLRARACITQWHRPNKTRSTCISKHPREPVHLALETPPTVAPDVSVGHRETILVVPVLPMMTGMMAPHRGRRVVAK